MKSMLRWIFDPYLNVFVIAIIIVHYSMGAKSVETGKDRSSASASSSCPLCHENEDVEWGCRHLDTQNNLAIR